MLLAFTTLSAAKHHHHHPPENQEKKGGTERRPAVSIHGMQHNLSSGPFKG